MGSDASAVHETPSLCSLNSVKVHLGICKQLLRLAERISCVIPKIEAARPGSSQGMQALCQLQKANDRAKELVQKCDSSKLYLAVIGNEIIKRFENTRALLVQSLGKLQTLVPVVLQSQISEILHDLRAVDFYMDPNEALAGKALKKLLERDESYTNSDGNSEIELLQFATSALHISSQKDLLIERRSLKKLLGKTNEANSKKRITLTYFFRILKKYDKQILQGQTTDQLTKNGQNYMPMEATDLNFHAGYTQNTSQISVLHDSIPPEEFKCYLSSNLMYDPVIISSGQTFERSYIQKWFDEGHDTCPKKNIKLSSLSMIPNNSMGELILKWSTEHGINISEPSSSAPEYGSLETYNSICSSASVNSMKDVHLHIDMSSISLGSLDSSSSSVSNSHNKLGESFSSIRETSDVDSRNFQFYHSIDDIQRRFLSNINELPWESQCRAVQDVNTFIIDNNPSCSFVSTENFLDPLVRFLHDALDKHDVEAQKVGNQLLLTYLRASRTEISQLNNDDVYTILASFLATEPMAETLSIVDLLSTRAVAIPHLAASGIMTSIIKLLDGNNREFQETCIKILYNLSMNFDVSSCWLASDWIPKLVPFLEDIKAARTCINILKNLSKFKQLGVYIVETNGCIASIIKLLETETCHDTQEHAVAILLFLCLQRPSYCQLVLYEGGVTALHHVSVHGNLKGKSAALELLRILREIKYEDEQESPVLDENVFEDHSENSDNKSTKTSRFAGWKTKIFSKKK